MDWDGTERRKNMDDLQNLKIEFASFTATIREWISSTKDFREQQIQRHDCLKEKIDKIDNDLNNHILTITTRMAELPCKERRAWHDTLLRQIKFIWYVVAIIVIAIIGEWVKKR